MENTSLINDIIKTNAIYFRNIKIGDSMALVEQIEGTPTEIKEYDNPFYSYYFEIGEMEEITIYYSYNMQQKVVDELNLHFIHYPEYYWKKEGNSDPIEFWNLLNNNQLQPYSTVFTNTVNDIIAFFTNILHHEPTISSEINGVFDLQHHNYKLYTWTVSEQCYLSIQTYIDDSIDNNIKNTMILRIV
jgi:hypothetical protein